MRPLITMFSTIDARALPSTARWTPISGSAVPSGRILKPLSVTPAATMSTTWALAGGVIVVTPAPPVETTFRFALLTRTRLDVCARADVDGVARDRRVDRRLDRCVPGGDAAGARWDVGGRIVVHPAGRRGQGCLSGEEAGKESKRREEHESAHGVPPGHLCARIVRKRHAAPCGCRGETGTQRICRTSAVTAVSALPLPDVELRASRRTRRPARCVVATAGAHLWQGRSQPTAAGFATQRERRSDCEEVAIGVGDRAGGASVAQGPEARRACCQPANHGTIMRTGFPGPSSPPGVGFAHPVTAFPRGRSRHDTP